MDIAAIPKDKIEAGLMLANAAAACYGEPMHFAGYKLCYRNDNGDIVLKIGSGDEGFDVEPEDDEDCDTMSPLGDEDESDDAEGEVVQP